MTFENEPWQMCQLQGRSDHSQTVLSQVPKESLDADSQL